MQAISDELQAILKSKFQAGASGFRGRISMISESTDTLACASGILAEITATADIGDLRANAGFTPFTVDPLDLTADGPSVAMMFWVARRTDTDMGNGDGSHLTMTNYEKIWTTRDGWASGFGGIGALGMLPLADGESAPGTVIDRDSSFYQLNNANAYDRAIGILIQTEETEPVQVATQMGSGGSVTFADFPTAGNVFICFRKVEDGTEGPGSGWTQIAETILPIGFGDTTIQCWARCIGFGESKTVGLRDTAKAHWAHVSEWSLTARGRIETVLPRVKRISIDKSLRIEADSAEVEFANEDFALGFGDDDIVKTNQRVAIDQWYGDEANAVRTFTGLVDRDHDFRDVLTTTLTMRDMMALLTDQTFSASGPQGADEDGAVRTEENGVYLSREISYIVTDLLTRAGWPTADLDIMDTSYVLDEFIVSDGNSYAQTIIGDTQLTGLVGYSAWADELGVFHFKPTLISQNFSDPTEIAYVFRANEDLMKLDYETDQYDLRTRIKVRGPLTTTTLQDTWRELWRTTKLHLPVGVMYLPSEPANIYVIDRGTDRLYCLRQSDRAIIASAYLGATIAHPLGLSGDPSDASIYWVLNAPWIDGGSGGNRVYKIRKSDNTVLHSWSIPSGRWSAIKVSASYIYLTNLDTDRFYRRSKADVSAISSYQHTYESVLQANPSGIMVDGTTLYLFWANGGTTARFLKCDESAPGSVTGVVKTAGTNLHGGEMDTTTHTECYGDSDSLGLVAKFTLLEAVDQTNEVSSEVVDSALEDELGQLALVEPRVHDTHPLDAAHSWEARRSTLDLTVITSMAQAIETAQRQLDLISVRRRVVDVGIIGNPAVQKTDLVAVHDPKTNTESSFAVDTYRTEMDAAGTYVGTMALIPVADIDDEPEDTGTVEGSGS